MASSLSSRVRFGAFDLNADSGELRKAGIPIKLRPQAIQVLLMLTERAGQVVTREEIRERLWCRDTFVDFERSINFCINQIRMALGDDAEKPRYVETLPRRGYRFIGPVTVDVFRDPAPLVSIVPPATESAPGGTPKSARSQSAEIHVVPASAPQPLATPWTKKRIGLLTAALMLASLAAGFAVLKRLSGDKGPSLQDMRMTKLTNGGAVTGVAISPDGRYVAYAKFEGDGEDLWLHQIAAQSDVQILWPGTAFHGLTFSPDGNFIYFVRATESNPYFKYLYSMPALGGPAKKLLSDVDSPVSFSPDGRQFVYEHCVEGRDDIELKVANADSSDDHLLAILHHATSLVFQPGPSWSPDGRTIVVPASLVGPRSDWVLESVSVADGTVREIFSRQNSIGRPVWWRGDTLLVPFYETAGQRAQLWTISFPDGKAQRFTNDLNSYGDELIEYPLDLSRDSQSLVALATTRTAKIWVAPSTTPGEAKEITNNELPLFSVAEAADGRLWTVSSTGQLWIMNADGSQGVPYGNYHDVKFITSCGRNMIVLQGETRQLSLTRLDADAKHPTELASGSLLTPFCSPDGKFVFYVSTDQPQMIWRAPVEGGSPVEIARILGDQILGQLSISPDGALIAYGYTTFVPSPGWFMATVPAAGGPATMTMPIQPDGAGPYWSPDGKALQFLWTHKGVTNIWEQPLSGGKPKQLTKFTSGMIFDINWSSDRRRLLMTRGEVQSNAILLSNLR